MEIGRALSLSLSLQLFGTFIAFFLSSFRVRVTLFQKYLFCPKII